MHAVGIIRPTFLIEGPSSSRVQCHEILLVLLLLLFTWLVQRCNVAYIFANSSSVVGGQRGESILAVQFTHNSSRRPLSPELQIGSRNDHHRLDRGGDCDRHLPTMVERLETGHEIGGGAGM